MGYPVDWINLIVRWAHFVAGVSWIGASFYFVWLDNHLTAPQKVSDDADGVSGELWAVHGGGFYHNQKYLTGPKNEPLSEHLHWFKWEAYSTWITGMLMLALIYWLEASTYLIDPAVLDLRPGVAIALSIGSLIVGWVVYDTLCKSLRSQPLVLGCSVFGFLVLMSWILFHTFSARAAFIHVGAIIGTIMVANVAHVIIPGQRKMLAQIRAGREPDPTPGILGKTRSVHNTYFTLPVLFTMISNHYPMTYSTPYGWLVLAAIGLGGVLVRYFFLLTHKNKYVWGFPLVALLLLVGVAYLIRPHQSHFDKLGVRQSPAFAEVQPIITQRCAVCHAVHPRQPGYSAAPAGVLLDTPEHIASNVARIDAQAVLTHNMPLGNLTKMTENERQLVGAWIAAGARDK
ncbi:MAG: urate hydroxylase PuuD [Candidatus Baltobacteraceae bacterium]